VPEETALRLRTPAALALALGTSIPAAARADDVPHLRWDLPIHCIPGPERKVVRIQCDDFTHPATCLVAPDQTAEGTALSRVNTCTVQSSDEGLYWKMVDQGATMVPAIAEAPPGFERSARGRAFQTKFDLYDRVYVGVAWAPTYAHAGPGVVAPGGFPFGRAEADIGMDASVLSVHGRSRHDMQVLKGTVALGDLNVNGLLFAYDYQHVHQRPGLWVTTFVGQPRVHPVAVPLGWGFRVMQVEDRPPAARGTLDMELAEAHVSWNPVQSGDMYNRLRFEAGADFGKSWADRTAIANGFDSGRWYVGFTSAMRSRVSLGAGGLHYLFADVAYVRPTLVAEGDAPQRTVNRVKAQLAYEGVVLAVNDQPISLRLAALGAARDDLSGGARNVEVGATAGLRFSFWAPPRLIEALPEIEDP
jgi:hypothetical protein